MSKIILISPSQKMALKVSRFSSTEGCEFKHYTEELQLEKQIQKRSKEQNQSNVINFFPQKPILPFGTHTHKKLNDIMYESIKNTLQQTRGNVIKACKILQISRSTLYRKVMEFDIDLNIIRHQTRKNRKTTQKVA